MDDFPFFIGKSSCLARHLTKDVYKRLCNLQTPNGFSFQQAIQCGVDHPDLLVGVLAGDEQSYETFSELFDAIIEDYHNGFKTSDKHTTDVDASKIIDGELDPKYILSSRIRTSRNIRGYCLAPFITRWDRRKLHELIVDALTCLSGEFQGRHFALRDLNQAVQKQLIDDHILFRPPVTGLFTSGGLARDFPDGRGIWFTEKKDFIVWINEEDHIRIIAMETGGNMKQLFGRFVRGLSEVELHFQGHSGTEFMWQDHLGYISASPSNLGTGLRCSVLIKLQHLGNDRRFREVCEKLRLEIRGTHGEHTESADGVYDISNRDRLGKSEVELVNSVIEGVRLLIKMETMLEKGLTIDELIP
ncbi:Arginine kinase [Holothuria leucospilota]|uniref:Arginine kinase n=1 Tax=Holothuria leucospilota TaxID=206669 RepID=A0A9Q1BTX0_HOLLE|nr:Arginine kinase [Holothuria leucospilota]